MSSAGHVSELDLLRGQVADLSRQLAERDRSMQDLREQSQLLRTIVEGTASETGDEFFTSLVRHLTSTLHVQYAVVSEVLEAPFRKIRTLAVSAGDTLIDNFEYDLDHTPCATALTQTFARFDRELQATFPGLPHLVDLGAESYCAVPVRTKDGAVRGLLVVMDTKPLQHGDDLQSLLEVFAQRVGAEFERERVEQERVRALAEIRNVIETVPDIMFTLDTHGNMVRWNRRVEVVTGYSREELLNMPALAFVPPEEHVRTATAIERAFTEGYAELEGHLLTKEYRTIPYHWTGALLKNSQGEPIGITGVGRDVSARRRAEEALQVSEGRLSSFMMNSPSLVFFKSQDGRYLFANPEFERMFHLPAGHIIGKTDYDVFPPEQADQFVANDRRVFQEGHHVKAEETARYRDGIHTSLVTKFPLRNADGSISGLGGIVTDITERKRAEAALRESEERYRTLVDLSPNGVLVYSNGKKVYVNQAACRIMGAASPEQLLENPTFHFSHPDDQESIHASIARILATGEPVRRVERKYQRLDGTAIFVEVDAGRIMWNGAPAIQVIFADISRRKQAEESLCVSEERFHAAFRSATVGMGLFDLTNRIIEANQAFSDITGYSEAELKNLTFLDITHPDDRPANLALQQDAVKGKRESFEVEKRYVRKNGEIVWVHVSVGTIHDASGQVTHTIGLITDITERKRSEEALRKSEAQFRALAESTTDWMWEMDEQGRYTYCSPKIRDLLGYEPAEALGKTPFDFMPEDEARRVAGLFGPIAAARKPFAGIENTNRRKDGQMVILECRGTPIIDDKGVFGGYRGFDQDITERKRSQEALRESEERLRLSLEAANQGIYDLNVQTGEALVSSGYATMLGHDPATFRETNAAWIERLHPDDREGVVDYYRAYVAGEIPEYRVEFRQRTRGGGWRWILSLGRIVERDARGEPLRMLGTHTDITERKQADLALHEREKALARFKATLDQTHDCVFMFAPDTLRFIYCNRGAVEQVGYSEVELFTMTPLDLKPEFTERSFREMLQPLQDGRMASHVFETIHRHKDGHDVAVEVSLQLVREEGQEGRFVAVVRDVTERKQAAAALRESEERFALAVRGSNTGIWDWDLRTGKTYFSPLWKSMLGYEEHELQGEFFEWEERLHPDDRERSSATVRAYLDGTTPQYELEHRLRHKDGSYRWILARGVSICDTEGKPYRMAGSHIDITEQKQIQEALAQRERQLQTVLDALPVGVWFTDRTGRLLLTNPAARQIWSGVRQIGIETGANAAGWWEATGPSGELHRWALSQALTKGIPSLYETLDLECLDGTKKTIRNSTVPVLGEAGLVVGALVLNEDITSLRQAQEALRLTQFSVDHAVEAFFWIDRHGNILNVNESACRMLEHSREELITMTVHDIDPNFPPELWQTHWAELKEKGSITFESKLWSHQGHVIDTEVTVNYLHYDGHEFNCAIMRDIGERRRAEDALRKSEARLRTITDAVPGAVYQYRLSADGTQQFPFMSQGIQTLVGVTSAEGENDFSSIWNRVLPEEVGDLWSSIRKSSETLSPWKHEFRILHADGTTRWIRGNSIPESPRDDGSILWNGILIDITDRKRMEETLRQRERDLRAAIEERERISQDLHDGILQSLFAVGLTLETTKSMLSSRRRKTSVPALDQAIQQLNLVMGEIRNFIAGLGPDLLQGNDLSAALQQMLASMMRNQATRVRVAVEDRAVKALSAEQSLHLVRVIQEAISNCIKHGRASEARVSLKMLKQGVRLSIRDNGRGFNQDAAKGAGHGLRNMAARARKLGGQFTVLSKVKEGTSIVLDLPKEVSGVSR